MHLLLVLALAVLFPAVHTLNGWLFDFATISSHISLIYLPAFLRLFNLLVLGPAAGTLTTVLGGLALMYQFNEPLHIALINIACSCAGPLMALLSFQLIFGRRVQLRSLKDLSFLTLMYCAFNSVLHHLAWQISQNTDTFNYTDAVWMFIGDFNGALLGAYLMKALIDRMAINGSRFLGSSQPKN